MPADGSPTGSAAPINNPQNRAANAYKTNSYSSLSEREIMAEAIRKIIHYIHTARDAHATKALETMVEYNIKTTKILDVLREELKASNALEDPEARAAASYLFKVYTDVIIRLAEILRSPAPQDEFNALVELLTPVYRAWLPPAPAAGDTQPQAAAPKTTKPTSA